MQQTNPNPDTLLPETIVTTKVAIVRLIIGLIQGLALYALYHAIESNAWPATEPYLFAPLLLVGLFVPVLLVSSLGHLEKRRAGAWVLVAGIIVAGLGFYDIWRGGHESNFDLSGADDARVRFFSPLVFIFTAAGLYISHALILAGTSDQRAIARYPTYFEMAWKLIIQVMFSTFFVGALWLVLWLGSALFMLVKLDFLKELLQKPWFAIPVISFAFSSAMHITDVRPAIVRGIRSLLLILMSWILPITTILVIGFLGSLPWTGLQPLWETRHATSVLLGTSALLIILINAAFQNGEMTSNVARVIRSCATLAALLPLPIMAIAIYALSLRVNQYGWTSDRVIAASCLLVACCYATGYALGAFRKAGWLVTVASTNVATAFVILAVLMALFTPIADPARLSVNSQMARFLSGKISAEKFDYDYLKFEGARYGRAALEQLRSHASGTDADLIREKAELALSKTNRMQSDVSPLPEDLTANIAVWPMTTRLPDSFLHEKWRDSQRGWELPQCLLDKQAKCDAYLIDFTGDGKSEILLIEIKGRVVSAILSENESGHWVRIGALPFGLANCARLREKLRSGEFKVIEPKIRDIEVGGYRIEVQGVEIDPNTACAALPK